MKSTRTTVLIKINSFIMNTEAVVIKFVCNKTEALKRDDGKELKFNGGKILFFTYLAMPNMLA
ncbi:CLUMA_CG012842, isoform A [Clunio marinus]|uniref:CLUMA_CG012842, isoform A n=1 Tax=Clunio marinus TaxID=568069 RepID=A0A1J1IH26_9DIPT|nr:CLUMA_CG012842, isoform A [Clunio marinus]